MDTSYSFFLCLLIPRRRRWSVTWKQSPGDAPRYDGANRCHHHDNEGVWSDNW